MAMAMDDVYAADLGDGFGIDGSDPHDDLGDDLVLGTEADVPDEVTTALLQTTPVEKPTTKPKTGKLQNPVNAVAMVILGSSERSWQTKANCMGVDPDLFFPERGASTREAKEVCRGCVVREDCVEFALANGEKFGIWGGLSERERRRLRRQRAYNPTAPIPAIRGARPATVRAKASPRVKPPKEDEVIASRLVELLHANEGAIHDPSGTAKHLIAVRLGIDGLQMKYLSRAITKLEARGTIGTKAYRGRIEDIWLAGFEGQAKAKGKAPTARQLKMRPGSKRAEMSRAIIKVLEASGGSINADDGQVTSVIAAKLNITSKEGMQEVAGVLGAMGAARIIDRRLSRTRTYSVTLLDQRNVLAPPIQLRPVIEETTYSNEELREAVSKLLATSGGVIEDDDGHVTGVIATRLGITSLAGKQQLSQTLTRMAKDNVISRRIIAKRTFEIRQLPVAA